MTDDDRRLADRLRRYESRVPVDADARANIRPQTLPWAALTGVAAVLVLAVVVATNLVTDRPAVGEASPTTAITQGPIASQSASSPASIAPSMAPEASEAPQSVASPSQTPAPSATGDPLSGTWGLSQTFGEGTEQPTFVLDATTWDAGFVAIGLRLDGQASDVGPYIGQPLIWTSADGVAWEEQLMGIPPDDDDFADSRIEHIATLPDGRLLAISRHRTPNAWVSADGESWTPIDLGIGAASVISVAAADRGLVLVATTGHGVQQAWFSRDGVAWEMTYAMTASEAGQLEAVGAGPEGFVIVGALRRGADKPHILASSDGRTWFTAPDQEALTGDSLFPFDVAPLGSDWIATGFGDTEAEQRSVIWRSPDGLAWTRELGPADPAGRNTYNATDLAGAAGHVILSPAEFCLCGAFQAPTVAWSTTDGSTWTTVDPDASYVTEVVASGSTVVAVGHIGRGESAAFWRLGAEEPDR